MKYNESEEMYLETILLLKEQKGTIRAVDVCLELQHAKSSVSKALGLLVKKGYVIIDEVEGINFTTLGKEKAEKVYFKHQIISNAFLKLGASKEVAEENACRMEHVITDELFEILKKHVEKYS